MSDKPDGGSGGESGGGDFTVSVDPTSLTVPIADSGTVTVSVQRTGTVGNITLTTDAPTTITATFASATLAEGTDSTDLTFAVNGGTAAAMSNITITATAGSITRTATVALTSTTITVTGTIRGNRSGIRVGLIGRQSILSSAGGVFTFTDVTPPYDLYTMAPGGNMNSPIDTVYYFDDLTRADPIVTAASTFTLVPKIFCGIISPCPAAAVGGTRTGSGNNTDPVIVQWSNGGQTTTLNGSGGYSLTALGFTSGTSVGNLYGLQFTRKANGAPDVFDAFGRSATTTLSDGGSYTINLAMSPVSSTASITGTIQSPIDYPAPTMRLNQQIDNLTIALWVTSTTTAVDATFPLIAAAGGNNFYVTTSLAGSGTTSYVAPLTATTDVSFTLSPAALLLTPADAATGITTATMFTFTGAANNIHEVLIGTSGTGTQAIYHVFTTAGQLAIPSIPELPLPANRTFTWNVTSYSPYTSINQVATQSELEGVSIADWAGPAHGAAFATSRGFTSAN